MTSIASDETLQVINYIKGNQAPVVASASHTTPENLTGLFARLKETYSNYSLTVMDYQDDGVSNAFSVSDYSSGMTAWKYPQNEKGSRSVVLVMTEEPFTNLNAGNVDDKFIVAFGVSVELGVLQTEERLYLEFGTVNLAEQMELILKNGPYDEIKSITTGLTSEATASTEITIQAKPITNSEDKIETIELSTTNTTANVKVNIQAVCMKLEAITNG